MLKLFKEELAKHFLTAAFAALGLVLCFIGKDAWAAIVTSVVPSVRKESLAAAVVLSLAINAVLLGYFIYSRTGPRRLRRRLVFFPAHGVWKHRHQEVYVCPSCLNNGLESFMREESDRFWCCQKSCSNVYYKGRNSGSGVAVE